MAQESEPWFWGRYAPDAWFADRANSSVMIRGYLALGARTPESPHDFAVWSGHFERSQVLVSWMRGSLEVPPEITFHFVGGENVELRRGSTPVRLPPGVYAVFMVPVLAEHRAVDEDAERDALARLDTYAGLVAAIISPDVVYQKAFEFLAEAGGPGTRVMSPAVRRPSGGGIALGDDTFGTMSDVMRAIGEAGDRLRARVTTSLRWYAHAHHESVRTDAFVKFWVALEALAFKGNGSPVPLIELLATSYSQDPRWVRETFAINQLAQLRNDIVHSGQRPMLHGKLLTFVDALYLDALRARLRLPNERRAERALPDGRPLRVPQWRNSGGVATAYLPEG